MIEQLRLLVPGEQLVYHRGFLACDRAYSVNNKAIHCIADIVYMAGMAGKIQLTQRKLGYCDYEYIATGAHRDHPR